MTKEEIIEAYRALGELVANEIALGEQMVVLSLAQRKAHNDTRLAREKLMDIHQ